jgi:hypothetical protein
MRIPKISVNPTWTKTIVGTRDKTSIIKDTSVMDKLPHWTNVIEKLLRNSITKMTPLSNAQ